MIGSDDELTVQREVEWPKEALQTEAIATDVLREAAAQDRREGRARPARRTTQAARVRATNAQLTAAAPSARTFGKLQLVAALALGALLAGSASFIAARNAAQPALPKSPTTVAHASEPVARAPVAEPAPAVPARAGDRDPAPSPPHAWTPSAAAAALAGNEYEVALRAYRALAELHPRSAVYGVIADVLARKLVHRCGQGASCPAL